MSEIKSNKISPATGTAFQLGDSGDTFTIPSGATITNSGTASGFGKVLQVVQSVKTDTFSTTSSSFVEVTGSGVSITPSSTSSKVLYMLSFHYSSTEAAAEEFAIYKNGSLLSGYSDGTKTKGSITRAATGVANYIYLDSPSTTSEVTYTLYIRETSSTYTANINAVLTAVAMEIGA